MGLKPLSLQARPFYLDTTAYLRAAAGPPAWSVRLSRIERLKEELEDLLRASWAEHNRRFAGRPRDLALAWQAFLEQLDLELLNELIEKHNAYYPIEARLDMQWPSGRYIVPAGMDYPLPRLTVERLSAYAECTE